MSPNKNQENQFIDFRLLTKKKEKPRFFLLFHQSDAAELFLRRFILAGCGTGSGTHSYLCFTTNSPPPTLAPGRWHNALFLPANLARL
jgi:hypothetical protein